MILYLEKTDTNFARIDPNMIKNRFDLAGETDYDLIRYTDQDEDITLMVKYKDYIAYLGLYLVPVSEKALTKIIHFVFKNNKKVLYVIYEYGYHPLGENPIRKNHFKIALPETREQLQERLSKKGRYNIAREKRILEQDFGSWAVHEYPAFAPEAESAWEKYFLYKSANYGEHWKNSNRDTYCKSFPVSHVYTLTLGEDSEIAAVILSHEDCPVVYLENLTYDPELAKYSLGKILYDEFLNIMIRKNKTQLFLLGGNYSYKKRYGSEEETVYNCSVLRNTGWYKLKVLIWNILVKLKIKK